MGVNIIERIQAKIELFRLEQRYTRRRHRRSTFVSNAIYVDGEYIYNTPNTTGSSSATASTNASASAAADPSSKPRAGRLNRWSSMTGFGSLSKVSAPQVNTTAQHDWRTDRRASIGR